MKLNLSRALRASVYSAALVLAAAPVAQAQTDDTATARARTSTVASGQKMKVKGVVTRRDIDANTFDVQDANGVTTTVALTDRTSVKTKGGFFGGGSTYGASNILRGLNLEVEGRGDAQGRLAASKVRFGDTDLRVAQSLQARVDPVESRVGSAEGRIEQVESNSQRLSGQLEELSAVSNAARGGAKAAQETADLAVAGVNASNERISALDDYTVQQNTAIQFKYRSAVLTPEAKQQLDEVARQALGLKGYVIEVRGFASGEGGPNANRQLSQRRADAVVRYLAETHNIPLRRVVTPFGYGDKQAVADSSTRAGREQNRRVEVSVLVNRGLTWSTPAASGEAGSSSLR